MSTAAAGSPLLQAARTATGAAYAPYSGWRVGAAAEFAESPGPHRGANVENASYGLTICGERAAILAGVVAGGRRLVRIAISCRDRDGSTVANLAPCGACLQVMAEFGSADMLVEIDGCGSFRLADFLPRPFAADRLRG
ncbi:MAG: cytidine deaminase [Planctomycetes bacterium]|nr:cytidine deaminase [Planctomycetota bacterium]MBM4057777.1 cytidine deaminase [Planctomycetota bacterium]